MINMDVKLFEVRDRGTLIPWLALQPAYPQEEAGRWLMERAGFGRDMESHRQYVFQGPAGPQSLIDDLGWGYNPDTFTNARVRMAALYIQANFETLQSGSVIDIEYLCGEKPEPKVSERLEQP